MGVSAAQKTRIGASLSGVGRKLTIVAKSPASVVVLGPGHGSTTRMSNAGLGLIGLIDNAGNGQIGLIEYSYGVTSSINNRGVGGVGLMNNDGIGEVGEI